MYILDLPNEVQARIFYTGTSDYHVQELPFPLLVSSVCAHWRSLAHGTPELWTLITPPLNNACLDHTQIWLTRSKAKLVSVTVDIRRLRSLPNVASALKAIAPLITKLLELLLKEAFDRLRRLDVCDMAVNMADTVERSVPWYLSALRNAPHLQQLSLCIYDLTHRALHSSASFGDIIEGSFPALTEVRLLGVKLPFVKNLTTLEAFSLRLSYQDVQVLFSTSPNLLRLSLENLIPITSVPSTLPLINAHSLRYISIRSEARVQESEIFIFSLLSMPNLIYLHLDGGGAISVASVFGSSLNSAPIETLRVTCSQVTFMGIHEKNVHMKVFHSLATLQNLQLIHGPAVFLSARSFDISNRRTRTRSIQGLVDHRAISQQVIQRRLIPSDNNDYDTDETQNMIWPNLHSIQMDSLLATDVASLCEFVTKRRGIRTVELSHAAMRHLSESLLRNGDSVYPIPLRAISHSLENVRVEGTKDVRQWLASQVTLKTVKPSDERLTRLGSMGIFLTEIM